MTSRFCFYNQAFLLPCCFATVKFNTTQKTNGFQFQTDKPLCLLCVNECILCLTRSRTTRRDERLPFSSCADSQRLMTVVVVDIAFFVHAVLKALQRQVVGRFSHIALATRLAAWQNNQTRRKTIIDILLEAPDQHES